MSSINRKQCTSVIFGTPGTAYLCYSLAVPLSIYKVFSSCWSVQLYMSSDDCCLTLNTDSNNSIKWRSDVMEVSVKPHPRRKVQHCCKWIMGCLKLEVRSPWMLVFKYSTSPFSPTGLLEEGLLCAVCPLMFWEEKVLSRIWVLGACSSTKLWVLGALRLFANAIWEVKLHL